jgi:hypothetical protein
MRSPALKMSALPDPLSLRAIIVFLIVKWSGESIFISKIDILMYFRHGIRWENKIGDC